MATKSGEVEALAFFNRLTNTKSESINFDKLSSAQRARFLSWCRQNGIDWSTDEDSSEPKNNPSIKAGSDNAQDLRPNLRIGIDIQHESELFPDALIDVKSQDSLSDIFTQREIAYAEMRQNPFESLTGMFAAKEAIVKASVAKVENRLSEIEINFSENGAPFFPGCCLSISHSKGTAVAVALKHSGESSAPCKAIKLNDSKISGDITSDVNKMADGHLPNSRARRQIALCIALSITFSVAASVAAVTYLIQAT